MTKKGPVNVFRRNPTEVVAAHSSTTFCTFVCKSIMRKILFSLFLCCSSFAPTWAAPVSLNRFAVRENSFASDELAIVAVDSAGSVQENVSGTFNFAINGFEEPLQFHHGTAFYRHKMRKSSFFYVKHISDEKSRSALYYIYKAGDKLFPVHISWILLLAIPILLVVLASVFKRLIIVAILLLLAFIFFTNHHGLALGTFFESILDGLKGIFK